MNEPKPKRRLPLVVPNGTSDAPPKRLMNEVLPDPTRRHSAGSARQRTLERMSRLLAIAAASTALGARCGDHGQNGPADTRVPPPTPPGYGVVDMLPPPPPDVVVAPPPPPPTPPGYGVVDMLPSPPNRPPHHRGRR